jgi:Kdo-III transferase WaaZ
MTPVQQPESPWNWLRRKLYRARLPDNMRHMRKAHPDFRLAGAHGVLDTVYWRGKPVGRILPLERLARATAPDCFIVATGPSINQIDFSHLQGRTCIGVNGSILRSEEYSLPFRSHVIADRHFFKGRFELVRKAMMSGAECLFTFRGLSVICERQPELLRDARVFLLHEITARFGQPKLSAVDFYAAADRDPDLVLHPSARPSKGWVGFSRDIRKGVFTGQTIAFSALQVAVWLGYTQIFILGMDLGGTGEGARFYESGEKAAPMRLDRDYESYIQPAFEVASKLRSALGIQIYNLSPDSRLPAAIIPKLPFADALEMIRQPA